MYGAIRAINQLTGVALAIDLVVYLSRHSLTLAAIVGISALMVAIALLAFKK